MKDKKNQQAFVTMRALKEVLLETEIEKTDGAGNTSKITTYMFNPFITKDAAGKNPTLVLSPGAMIKTGVLIGDLIYRMNSSAYDSRTGLFASKKLNFMELAFASILDWILTVVMAFGIIGASVFFAVQYTMTLFEYYIAGTVGIMFIPFMLWEPAKAFAESLITMFKSFFVKIVVMLLCVFFTYSLFLKFATDTISSAQPVTFMTFAHCLFIIILGFVVTQNAPQIAVTLLHGNPQLSMGEFMHAAGAVAASALGAKKAVQGAAHFAVPKVQAINRAAADAAARQQGISGTIKDVNEKWADSGLPPLSGGERASLRAGAAMGMIAQGAKNKAAGMLTGQKPTGAGSGAADKNGKLENTVFGMGQGNSDASITGGAKGYGKTKETAKNYAESLYAAWEQKNASPQTPAATTGPNPQHIHKPPPLVKTPQNTPDFAAQVQQAKRPQGKPKSFLDEPPVSPFKPIG